MPCLSMNFNRQFVELYKTNLTFSFDKNNNNNNNNNK